MNQLKSIKAIEKKYFFSYQSCHTRMCFLVYKIDMNGSYHGCQNLNYKYFFSVFKNIDKGVDKVLKKRG